MHLINIRCDRTFSCRQDSMYKAANFICTHGQYSDLMVTTTDSKPFLSAFGIYINRIADMKYMEELLKVLISMQTEIDSTEEIDETDEEIINEMEM